MYLYLTICHYHHRLLPHEAIFGTIKASKQMMLKIVLISHMKTNGRTD